MQWNSLYIIELLLINFEITEKLQRQLNNGL